MGYTRVGCNPRGSPQTLGLPTGRTLNDSCKVKGKASLHLGVELYMEHEGTATCVPIDLVGILGQPGCLGPFGFGACA
jgi:hypothetical protein